MRGEGRRISRLTQRESTKPSVCEEVPGSCEAPAEEGAFDDFRRAGGRVSRRERQPAAVVCDGRRFG